MRSFWISLFFFILLMCSCRSKEVVSDVQLGMKHVSELSYLNENVRVDTARTAYTEQVNEFNLVHEIIVETEYDTDKNVIEKVTETKRTFVQDSQTDIAEEVRKSVETYSRDSVDHIRDVTKKIKSETESVTENQGLASVWDKFGEVMGIGTLVVIAYLCWKLKSRVR